MCEPIHLLALQYPGWMQRIESPTRRRLRRAVPAITQLERFFAPETRLPAFGGAGTTMLEVHQDQSAGFDTPT